MFKNLVIVASLALAAVSAQATVMSPSVAFSADNVNPYVQYPAYAGDAAQGEMSRMYDVFNLPVFQSGSVIRSAIFSITVNSRYNNASNPLGLYAVTTDPTGPTSWSNMPALGTLLTSFNPSQNSATYTFDVTSFINEQYQADGKATLALAGLTEGAGNNSWTYLGSSSLNVQTKNVPEPASLALLGLGVAGMGALRRNKKA